jgi:hypothetical protein
VSTGRRLARGPFANELVSSATGRDHSSRQRHQWPTAASRLSGHGTRAAACSAAGNAADSKSGGADEPAYFRTVTIRQSGPALSDSAPPVRRWSRLLMAVRSEEIRAGLNGIPGRGK